MKKFDFDLAYKAPDDFAQSIRLKAFYDSFVTHEISQDEAQDIQNQVDFMMIKYKLAVVKAANRNLVIEKNIRNKKTENSISRLRYVTEKLNKDCKTCRKSANQRELGETSHKWLKKGDFQ